MRCAASVLALCIVAGLSPVPAVQRALAQEAGDTVDRAESADRIIGTWLVDTGGEQIHVRGSRNGSGYDARIVWVQTPVFPDDDPEGRGGLTKLDWHNPDPELRKRPIVGLTLVQGIEYDPRHDRWGEGHIYAPDQGRTYRCTMQLRADGRLAVRGYFKVGFIKLGRTVEWTRVQ